MKIQLYILYDLLNDESMDAIYIGELKDCNEGKANRERFYKERPDQISYKHRTIGLKEICIKPCEINILDNL